MTDKEQAPTFPVLEIKAFVDSTTVVLVGPHADNVNEDDELFVLGIGDTNIPGTNIPLITPKAKLEVTFPAGEYILARSPTREYQVNNSLQAMFGELATRTVRKRDDLTKDESLFLGNPGRRPVAVGDVVVRSKDVADYIKWRAGRRKAE